MCCNSVTLFILYTWHLLHLSVRGEASSSVALLKVSSLFPPWKFFLIHCEVLGQGCRKCTDCKALWSRFVICDIRLYKINWIELNWTTATTNLIPDSLSPTAPPRSPRVSALPTQTTTPAHGFQPADSSPQMSILWAILVTLTTQKMSCRARV